MVDRMSIRSMVMKRYDSGFSDEMFSVVLDLKMMEDPCGVKANT